MDNKTNLTSGHGQKLRPPVLPGSKINLPLVDEFRGKTVFLVFHRGVSDPENQVMVDNLGKLELASSSLIRENVQIITISTDKIEIEEDPLVEDENKNKANILLVSDETGHTSKRFGVLDTEKHESLMSLFVLGPDGVVKGSRVWGEDLQPTLEEFETILKQYTGLDIKEDRSLDRDEDDVDDLKYLHISIKEESSLDQDEEWPVPRLTQITSSSKGYNNSSKGSNNSSKEESHVDSKGSNNSSKEESHVDSKGSNNSSKGGNDSFKESNDSSKRIDNSSKESKNASKGAKNIEEDRYNVLRAIDIPVKDTQNIDHEEAGGLNANDMLNKSQDLNTDFFKGKWKRTSYEYEEFHASCFHASRSSFMLREACTMSTPVMEITEEDGMWSIKTYTMELKFKLGEEFEETTYLEIWPFRTTVTLEGNKLISVQKATKPGQQSTRVVREFNGDECVQTSTVDGKKVVCVQKFERMV